MKKPFAFSFVFHALILLAALVVLPVPRPFDVKPPEAIQVDISTIIADKTQKTAQTKDPAPLAEKPAPKETKPVPDAPPAPKVAEKVNTASHEPTKPPPEPAKKPDPPKPQPDTKALDQMLADDAAKQAELQKTEELKKLEEQKKAEAKKKAEELKKVEEKKKAEQKARLDKALAEAQAQLNKISGENTAPAKPADKKGSPKQTTKDQQGADQADSATLAAALVSKVKQCFNIPPAAREANVSVPVHFMLNRDGSVMGQPEAASDSPDPIVQATARAAISAIMECQNYDLPADQYDQWKDNTLDFNPTQISG